MFKEKTMRKNDVAAAFKYAQNNAGVDVKMLLNVVDTNFSVERRVNYAFDLLLKAQAENKQVNVKELARVATDERVAKSSEPINKHKRWENSEKSVVINMKEGGHAAQEIGHFLGRTKASIYNQIGQLRKQGKLK